MKTEKQPPASVTEASDSRTEKREADCAATHGSATATRNRFLDNLSGMTGKGMWHLLEIETVDELAELYVECVHQKRPDDVRQMAGFVLHAKLGESRSWPNVAPSHAATTRKEQHG